jgi:hypothetical protein
LELLKLCSDDDRLGMHVLQGLARGVELRHPHLALVL